MYMGFISFLAEFRSMARNLKLCATSLQLKELETHRGGSGPHAAEAKDVLLAPLSTNDLIFLCIPIFI